MDRFGDNALIIEGYCWPMWKRRPITLEVELRLRGDSGARAGEQRSFINDNFIIIRDYSHNHGQFYYCRGTFSIVILAPAAPAPSNCHQWSVNMVKLSPQIDNTNVIIDDLLLSIWRSKVIHEQPWMIHDHSWWTFRCHWQFCDYFMSVDYCNIVTDYRKVILLGCQRIVKGDKWVVKGDPVLCVE